jgi:hypothetical protein
VSDTTGWPGLDRLLAVDPADGGCALAMELLHSYAELLAADGDVAARYPAVAAHVAACGPCAGDLAGLLAALQAEDD